MSTRHSIALDPRTPAEPEERAPVAAPAPRPLAPEWGARVVPLRAAGRIAAKACGVVVVSYKTGPVLLECVESALAQPDVRQLVLVDNGNPRSMLRALNGIADRDARLEIVTGHGNVGFARGCNIGARRARHPFLLLLNPDATLGEGVLARGLDAFDAWPGAALLGARLENPDGSEQRGGRRNLPTPWSCVVEQLRLDRLAPEHPRFRRMNLNEAEPLADTAPVECISGAFMLMPRETFDELDGMDEDYFLHVEDVDFCRRVGERGGAILYAPDVPVTHRRGASRVWPGFVEWHKSRGFAKYFFKHFRPHYPGPLLAAFSAAIYARFALRLPAMTLRWMFRLPDPNRFAPARPARPAAR